MAAYLWCRIVHGSVPSEDYFEFVNTIPEHPDISQELLLIHAAIAEVLHVTGVSEAIVEIYVIGSGSIPSVEMGSMQVY